MTKVLFLAHTAAPSGAELATLRLLAALREQRLLEVAMIYTEDGPMVERMRARGIETRVLRGTFDSRAMTIGAGPLRLVAGFAALLRLGWALGALVREQRGEVLVAESTKALVMGAVAARRARVPLIWQVHDRIAADYFGALPMLVIKILGRLLSHGYIANSRTTLATLPGGRPAIVAYPGVDFGAETAPNGSAAKVSAGSGTAPDGDAVQASADSATAPDEQRPGAETVVAVVGRLAPWKGQDVFLRALAATKVRPRRVFLIGGAFFDEEPFRLELERIARNLALPVTFTGHVDDPSEYLWAADILVHCSVLPEPFGQVVVEGMRAGCAVIAARPGGPAEIIEPDISGVLVDGGDERQLTGALDRLIGDPALRTQLAAQGRIRARHFDIAASARTVAGFLDTAVKNRRSRRGVAHDPTAREWASDG